MIYAVSTERTIGLALFAVLMVGWVIYVFVNIRQSKPELGSDTELAPNRKALPTDEVFEGPRLEQVQAWGVLFLVIIGLSLPIYWLLEPGRQAGAVRGFTERSIARGETAYVEGFQCASCHGLDLTGGAAPTVIEIPRGGELVKVRVNWAAPPLDDVFYRFDTDIDTPLDSTEVRSILNFGRAPVMPAWGLPGGGPANVQQIQDLVDYLWDSQISPEDATQRWQDAFQTLRDDPENSVKSDGQILFELNCARCHTPQWNAQGEQEQPNGALVEVIPGQAGGGGNGPQLSTSSLIEQFPDIEDQIRFVLNGADQDVGYGEWGVGEYGMPGFSGYLTEEQVRLIVEYERSLTQTPGVTSTATDEEPGAGQ